MRRFNLASRTGILMAFSMGGMTPAERSKGRFMRAPDDHPSSAAALTKLLTDHTAAIEKKLSGLGVSELKNRLDHMEQAATRPGSGLIGIETKSFGAQVAESEEVQHLREQKYRPGSAARIELKAINTAGGSAGGLITPQTDSDIAGFARRPLLLRNLLTVVPTGSGSIDYAKQSTRTNNAAPVAEGQQKPYSNYGWTKANVPVRTIAHLAKLTRQAMDDSAQLMGEVDSEMRYGLQLAEDAQILLGDGQGENLLGLMPQATAYAVPAGFTVAPDATLIDKLGAAILQQLLTNFTPDGIALNPVDWMTMRMLKDANGNYLFGKPGADVPPVLFGLPIAATQAMPVGSYLLGAFKAQKLYDRMEPEVLISSENADDFEKNLLTMRCEERLALAARQPGALIKGQFATT